MKHTLRILLFTLSTLNVLPAYAVINGTAANPISVATGKLSVDQLVWYSGVRGFITEVNECSSVVVGTRPLTVLTAAHCLRHARLHPVTRIPVVSLSLVGPVPPLQAAVYSDFESVESNLARDIAVLVFSGDASPGVKSIPISDVHVSKDARVCGYGYGHGDVSTDSPRCARKELFSASDPFVDFLPASYEPLDPLLYLQFRAQFEAKKAFLKSSNTMLAVNRLWNNEYDVSLPMPTRGDSGGPWMIHLQEDQHAVVALTSFIETFYRKNKQWPFFRESRAPLNDFAYVAYGVRLDTTEAKALFVRARMQGADINYL